MIIGLSAMYYFYQICDLLLMAVYITFPILGLLCLWHTYTSDDSPKSRENEILDQAHFVRNSLIAYYGYSKGFCFDASCVLIKRLADRGINAQLVEGRVELHKNIRLFHYWVQVDDHVLDVTGDQFNVSLPSHEQIPTILFVPKSSVTRYHKDEESAHPMILGEWASSCVSQR